MRHLSWLAAVLASGSVLILTGLPGGPAAAGTGTGTPGYAITPIRVPPGAFGVGVDESTDMVYAVEAYGESLSVIDGTTGIVKASVPLGIYPAFLGVAVDPATDTIYVDGTVAGSKNGASVVKVISGANDAVLATVRLPGGTLPGQMAVNPLTGTVYVTEKNQAAIAVIDGTTDTMTTSVSLGYHTWPNGIAVNSSTGTVYVTNANTDTLSVVNAATNVLADTVALPGVPGPDGPSSVVADASTNTVFVATNVGLVRVDGSSDAITADLTAEHSDSLALDSPAGTLYAYEGSRATTVINAATLATTASIPVGGQAMAVDSLTHTEFIASGTVGVDLVAVTPGVSPVITSSPSATFTAGRPGTFTVTATGTPAPVFSETGSLPGGVHFSASGVLSGTPAVDSGGKYRLTITAANTVNPSAVSVLTVTVHKAPSITSVGHASFRAGRRNHFTVVTRGYPAATLKESGRLPRGVRFEAHGNGTATLTGTPRRSDRGKHFVVRIIASNGVGSAAIQRFTLTVR